MIWVLNGSDSKSWRMRFLALAFVLMMMMVSSCLATNRKTLMVEMHEQEQQQLIDQDMSKPGDSNDHHYIPREKFAPYDNGIGVSARENFTPYPWNG